MIHGEIGAERAVAGTGHEAPGVAVALEVGSAVGSVGIEIKIDVSGEGGDGNDVPGIARHDVGDEEIDFVGSVGLTSGDTVAVAGLNIISIATVRGRTSGLDLHAPEMAAGVEDEVIGLKLAVRFGDSETEVGGLVHEREFGDLSATLAKPSAGAYGRISFHGK